MEEKYIYLAIGIFLALVTVVLGSVFMYVIFKHVLPKIENKRNRKVVGLVCVTLLVLGLAPCLSLCFSLISNALG